MRGSHFPEFALMAIPTVAPTTTAIAIISQKITRHVPSRAARVKLGSRSWWSVNFFTSALWYARP